MIVPQPSGTRALDLPKRDPNHQGFRGDRLPQHDMKAGGAQYDARVLAFFEGEGRLFEGGDDLTGRDEAELAAV